MRQINTVKLSMSEVCDVCVNLMHVGETAYAVGRTVIVCDACHPAYEQLLNNEPNETASDLAKKLSRATVSAKQRRINLMPDQTWKLVGLCAYRENDSIKHILTKAINEYYTRHHHNKGNIKTQLANSTRLQTWMAV